MPHDDRRPAASSKPAMPPALLGSRVLAGSAPPHVRSDQPSRNGPLMPTTRREALRAGAAGAAAAAGLARAATAGAATGASAGGRPPNILILMCDQERYPQ